MAAGPEAEGAGRHAGHREDSTRSTGRTARGAQGRCSPAGCEDSTQSTGKVLHAGCGPRGWALPADLDDPPSGRLAP